jgi:uncharacterized protein YegL
VTADQPAPGARPVLACYLAVDTGDPMRGAPLAAASAEVARIWDAVRTDPRLSGTCRLGLVTFDARARVQVPLACPADVARPPRLALTRPGSDDAALSAVLRDTLRADRADLVAAGLAPLRPVVVVLTGGAPPSGRGVPVTAPGSTWCDAGACTPRVLAFGIGRAAAVAVRRIGTDGAHLPDPGVPGGAAVPPGLLPTTVAFLLGTLRDAGGSRDQSGAVRAASARSATSRGVSPSVGTTTSATLL